MSGLRSFSEFWRATALSNGNRTVGGVLYMTRLYIVRHGQTEYNAKGMWIGRTDAPLNETGEMQARNLARKLSGTVFEAMYTSPMQRAVNTAAPTAAEHKDVNLVMNYGLTERDFGEWECKTREEIESGNTEMFNREGDGWFYEKAPGGESMEQVYVRSVETVDKILSQHSGGNVLLVTHHLTAKCIIAHLLGLAPASCDKFFVDNCGMAIIEYSDGKGTLRGLNM